MAELPFTANDVGQTRVAQRCRVHELGAGRYGHVQILRVGDYIAHGSLVIRVRSGENPYRRPIYCDYRHIRLLDVAIARVHHLVRGRQVGPELETIHFALGVAFGHLLMHDSAACGHPLHVASADDSLMPEAVAVLDIAFQHVGYSLDPAMRVPGEAFEVVGGRVRPKIVEQQKWVE